MVTITTTDFAFQAPDTIPSGAVELRLLNRGPGLHHVWLMRLAPGHRAVDLLSSYREGQPLPSWVQEVGGPNVPPLGKPAIVTVGLLPEPSGLASEEPRSGGRRPETPPALSP